MNFQGKAVLVYLEEDNIARSYFRVQPLLTQDGPVGDTQSAFPDDGYLRIVPDKNEQHTFKERMRTLCGLCIIDLRYQPAEANKIRTNKNYSPSRGETNQYILYSDAVRPMQEDMLYQVVAEENVQSACTPSVYIRNGANIQGPFRREDAQPVGEASPLAPDSSEIHAVTVNGQELLFYWPKVETPSPAAEAPSTEEIEAPAVSAESAPAPAEEKREAKDAQQNAYDQIQSLNVAPSAHANRLHEPTPLAPIDFVPEQPARPLSGTKLYQTPQRQTSPRRAHNPLMETVESQRYAARYEAPGATLPQSAELKEVANPADTFKRALQGMMQSPETQRQTIDLFMAQTGMRPLLFKALSKEANDLTVAAMQGQLQEMEAERLMTLMQLDDVKKNLAAAREEAIGKLNMAEQRKLDELHIAQQQAKQALDELKQAIAPMEQNRQALAEKIQNAEGVLENAPHFVAPQVGKDAEKEELISRVEACLTAAGFKVEKGDAQAMLTAFALAKDEWECAAASDEDAWLGLEAFAAALGVKMENTGYKSDVVLLPGGNAPVLLNVRYPHSDLVTSCYTQSFADRKGNYADRTVPSVPLYPDVETLPGELPVYGPVSRQSIVKAMLQGSTELSADTRAVITSLRKAAAESGLVLPLNAVSQLCRFVAATQNDMPGGLAEALDRAVCLYLTPYLIENPDGVLPLLAAMPRTLKALNA